MNYVTGTLAVLLLILVAVFSIQNLEAVELGVFFWSFSVPKFALIIVVYVLGMVSGWGLVELFKAAF